MAAPLDWHAWRDALKAEGVTAVFADGWTTAGRDTATGKTFGPVHGVVIHHTAGADSLAVVKNGRPDLPGPLAHAHLAKDGRLTQLSTHRCNHAGTFAQNAVDAVINEVSLHPRPAEAEPVDANDSFYGLEIENRGNGSDPYPAVQYDQAVRWAAAICRAHGWSADSVIGHKEGTRRKVDPSFPMTGFRAAVAERLSHPASWAKSQTPTPPEEKPVAEPTAADIAAQTWKYPVQKGDTTETWTAAAQLRAPHIALGRVEKKLDALTALVNQLLAAQEEA